MQTRFPFFVALLGCLFAISQIASAIESGNDANLNDLWKDPTFQKNFLGSYGFVSELEPRVTPEEREELQKLMAVMSKDMAAAQKQLEALAKPDNAVMQFTLGNVYFQTDQQDKAAERYKLAIAKFPNFRRAHKNLALVQVQK